jgi:predicted nucleic acid-binding protein
MIIADTSIWIEFLKANHPFYSTLGKLLEERQVVSIECIFGELLQGAKSKREKSIIESFWENLPRIEEEGIWIAAGNLSSDKKMYSKGVGLIDVAIVSTARSYDLKVWTLDKKLTKILHSTEKFVI